jgi:hypothetical protein
MSFRNWWRLRENSEVALGSRNLHLNSATSSVIGPILSTLAVREVDSYPGVQSDIGHQRFP